MIALTKSKVYTAEEYLEFEVNAEERHEFLVVKMLKVTLPGW